MRKTINVEVTDEQLEDLCEYLEDSVIEYKVYDDPLEAFCDDESESILNGLFDCDEEIINKYQAKVSKILYDNTENLWDNEYSAELSESVLDDEDMKILEEKWKKHEQK